MWCRSLRGITAIRAGSYIQRTVQPARLFSDHTRTDVPESDLESSQTTANLTTTEILTKTLKSLDTRIEAKRRDLNASSNYPSTTLNSNINANNPYGVSDYRGRDPLGASATSASSGSDFVLHMLHVNATPNNTIITLTDNNGQVLINCSGGTAGFRKAQRSGPEAAYQATQQLVNKVSERGIKIAGLHLKLNGFGPGREAVYRALRVVSDWELVRISDATPIPFNGCRPRKKRRL